MNDFTFEDAMEIREFVQEVTVTEYNNDSNKIDYCQTKNGNAIYPLEQSYMKLDNSDKVLAFLWEASETINNDGLFITRVSKKAASLNKISANCVYTVTSKSKINGEWIYSTSDEKNVSKTQVKKILDNLKAVGILKEDDIYYYLDVDFERLNKYGYSIVDDNTSKFLSGLNLKDTLKVYTYLLFRFRKFNNFTFTKKNLAELLGYKINKQGKIEMAVSIRLGDMLYLLNKLELIDVDILYKNNPETGHKYQYFVLKNVSKYNPDDNKFNMKKATKY